MDYQPPAALYMPVSSRSDDLGVTEGMLRQFPAAVVLLVLLSSFRTLPAHQVLPGALRSAAKASGYPSISTQSSIFVYCIC